MVTAAHCLYVHGQRLTAADVSVLLGLHDRRQNSGTEGGRSGEARCLYLSLRLRKLVDVTEVMIHLDFDIQTEPIINDIALLKLGMFAIFCNVYLILFIGERVDLFIRVLHIYVVK